MTADQQCPDVRGGGYTLTDQGTTYKNSWNVTMRTGSEIVHHGDSGGPVFSGNDAMA